MDNALRNLSVVEVYHRIESYNRQLGEFLLDEDMEGFNKEIDDFLSSGITENPNFEDALTVYRIARPHYYIEGIPSDLVIQALQDKGYFMDVPATFPRYDDSTIMNLAVVAEESKTPAKGKRRKPVLPESELENDFSELIDLYNQFIDFNVSPSTKANEKDLKIDCYNAYIAQMIDHRRIIDCSINFNKFAIKSFTAEDKLYYDILKKDTFFERLKIIEETVEKIYSIVYTAGNALSFKDFYEVKNPHAESKEEKAKYRERQFMIGLGFHHAVITDMASGKYPTTPFFYVALAMFLSIPTTNRVEAFINKFGYTLNSPFVCLYQKEVFGKTYYFYGEHFRKWFDSGIDYYLIYQLLSKEWGTD